MGFVPGKVPNIIGLHTLAHHATDKDMTRQYVLTNQYHVSLLASLMSKLKSIDEGGSTLLDNTMILFGSNVRDSHNGENVPLILAGGGGGTLKPGSTLLFKKMWRSERLCNLHLAMLQRMDVTANGRPIGQFGNSLAWSWKASDPPTSSTNLETDRHVPASPSSSRSWPPI